MNTLTKYSKYLKIKKTKKKTTHRPKNGQKKEIKKMDRKKETLTSNCIHKDEK